jgi:hypothetical protein
MFSSEQIATRHRKTCGQPRPAREQVARETRCHFCGKDFSSVYKLATHVKSHEGQLEFECNECGKQLASRAALNKHVLSHGKDFQCELCQKLFSRKDNLQAHFQTHFKSASKAGSSLVVEYICSFCQGTVSSREDLVAHLSGDTACGRQCHQHLREVGREEEVESSGDVAPLEEKSEIILVDNDIQGQDILIIEEPVKYL